MSIRSDRARAAAVEPLEFGLAAASVQSDAEAPAGSQADNPLQRKLHVSIRSTLSDLCLNRGKSTWKPSTAAMESIMKQQKFTALDGSADKFGDLKSVVLHDMSMVSARSSFPLSVGASISTVDSNVYTSTGRSFATVLAPNHSSDVPVSLQADNTDLAYEFAGKFPGYTAQNLAERGVHEVSARNFVLIAADHPIVTAISENAERLQVGEVSMMPEGLVKISSELYSTIMPMVKSQVANQIKVRDFSNASVSLHPAEYASWSEARDAMLVERKGPVKAEFEARLAANPSQESELRAEYAAKQNAIERALDFSPFEAHFDLNIKYNFLSEQPSE